MRSIATGGKRGFARVQLALGLVALTLGGLFTSVATSVPAAAQTSAAAPSTTPSPGPASSPGFDSTTSVPVDSETTPTKRVFANTNGTRTAQLSNVPVRFKGTDNAWHDIDNTLVS